MPRSSEPLLAAGLRATTQRIAILDVLDAANGEALEKKALFQRVFQRKLSASQATLYRLTRVLEMRGLLCRVIRPGGRLAFRLPVPRTAWPDIGLWLVDQAGTRWRIDDADLGARVLDALRLAGVGLGGERMEFDLRRVSMPGVAGG